MPKIVIQGPGPWGFRLVGGKDFEQPLAISRVRSRPGCGACSGAVRRHRGGELTGAERRGPSVERPDSEVYKMLQEKQELNEPPKQSTSFLVLQEILESEEKGFRSVKAPVTKVAASIGNAQKLPMCDKCGTGIVGIFVKLRDKHRHPECYVCTDCGTNLKQKGHFFVEDCIYCEKHARERVTPPEGYDVVTVFPK
uniref:PDZ and LIM domain 1 n=1 Tax=Vombatus ursinus TaxID=29139 RepID=A0A4X2JUT4_VOMUR